MGHTARLVGALFMVAWAAPVWAAQAEPYGRNFFLSALGCALALVLCVQFGYLVMRRLLRARARLRPPEPPEAS